MGSFLLRHRRLISILALYCILGLSYSVAVPLAETPDESEHFLYLQYIAQQRALPVMSPEREENYTLEAHQPPLLYLIGAVLTSWIEMDVADNLPDNPCFSFEPDDIGRKHVFLHVPEEWPPRRGVFLAFHIMRWVSLLLGAGTVWLTYQIGRQLTPSDDRIGLTAAAILAFNPQFIFITASLNNDVPTTFLGAAMVALCVKAYRQPRRRLFAGLGILVGLGILTKFALFAFWPMVIVAVYLASIRSPGERKHSSPLLSALKIVDIQSLILNLLLVIILPLVIAGWWYWRAYQLHGDPLMWEVTLAAKRSIIARLDPFSLADLFEFVAFHFQSYWVWFGWLNIKAPPWIYGLLVLLVGLAVVGLLRLAQQRHFSIDRVTFGFCGLAIMSIYASLFRYIQTVNWTGYQGRLAFAAAAPIAVFLALGLITLGGKQLALSAGGTLFLLSAAALPLLILPAYPRPQIYQPGLDLTRTCARFDEGLQVEAVAVNRQVQPGGSLQATVYGYGLTTSEGLQSIGLQLVGRGGIVVSQGVTTIEWDSGQVLSATIDLPLSEGAQPARATLEVGMLTLDGEWQKATSATRRNLEVPLGVAQVKIAPMRPFAPSPQKATEANFDDQVALIGYDLARKDHMVTVTLYWQAISEMSEDYTTFIHLKDASGQIIAQVDGQPQSGGYPTAIWDVGEIVADTKMISLPEGENNSYQLVTGVYLLETGQRLPLADSVGGGTISLSLEATE